MRIGGKRMFVGTIRDITDRKEREASEVYLRNLLNTIVDGLITIDETGNVLSANPAAERLFGYVRAGDARAQCQDAHAGALPVRA